MDTFLPTPTPDGAWWADFSPGMGLIDPRLLAPDLDQPRTHIRESELQSLDESIAEHGVRDHLVVTPRSLAPWARVAREYADLIFVIVSGHRRRTSAIKAGHKVVPILIRHYTGENQYREDAAILNAARQDLTELEQGWEAIRQQKLGIKPAERIMKSLGLRSISTYYDRVNLTRLAPDLQRRLSPELSSKRRLSASVGGALGGIVEPTAEELEDKVEKLGGSVDAETGLPEGDLSFMEGRERRFALQRLLLGVIVGRNMPAVNALAFIQSQKLELKSSGSHGRAGGHKTEKFEPRRRREVLDNFLDSVRDSVVIDWEEAEWDRIFYNASQEEVAREVARVRELLQTIGGIAGQLERIRDRKSPTPPEVARLVRERA